MSGTVERFAGEKLDLTWKEVSRKFASSPRPVLLVMFAAGHTIKFLSAADGVDTDNTESAAETVAGEEEEGRATEVVERGGEEEEELLPVQFGLHRCSTQRADS